MLEGYYRKLEDVKDLLQEVIIHRMTQQIKYNLDGTIFFIEYDALGSKKSHSKTPLLTLAKK